MSSFSNSSRPQLDSNFMQQQQNPIPSGPPYQDPFSATNKAPANNNYQNPFASGQPILPGMQASSQASGLQSMQANDILTLQQLIFLKQIQSFLVQHNLEVVGVLTKDLGVMQSSTHTSRDKLEDLGRHARVDMIESQQLDTLVTRLIDPTSRAPYNLSIAVLRQLLNTTGVSTASETKKGMQVLKEFIISRKVASVEQLFPEAGESGLVEKELFVKRASEEGKVNLEDAQTIATKFLEANGKVNLKNMNIELSGGQVPQQIQQVAVPLMTREQAQEIVNKVFDQIKRYIAMNEVNIVDIFRECEKDDGYFDRQELSDALSRLSFTLGGSDHDDRIDAIFNVYDQQRTRKLDYQQVLTGFYKRANAKQINEPTNRLFKVYDATRRYMKQKQFLSLASIFIDDYYIMSNQSAALSVRGGLELAYDTNDFIHQLTKVVGVKELDNYALQQSFVLALRKSDTEYDKIDYHRFADAVGYEVPLKSNKDEIRKHFYRQLLKDVGSVQNLEGSLRQQDINLQGSLQVNVFINVIESFSQQLAKDSNVIKQIAGDFALNGQTYQINYQAFIQILRAEIEKQAALQKNFRSFHEHLQFKDTKDLYGALFSKVDPQIEKRFSKNQLKQVLTDKLGLGAEIAHQDVEQFFFEYDLSAKSGFVKFIDIEKDFSEYLLNERKLGRLSQIMNLPAILRIIRQYVDMTGQTLRQIFGKTKFGDNDHINQYQFTKVLHMIAQQVGGGEQNRIDDTSLHMFMNEISTTTTSIQSNSPTKERHDNSSKHVSFNELQSLYNMTFNVKDDDADSFIPMQVERLIVHLAKVTLENQRNNFELKSHFLYPASPLSNFINDLKKQPLNCFQDHPQNILEELGKKYQGGHNQAINTQMLVMDIERKVDKLKEKNTIFSELRKQVLRKNQNIEIVFSQALPEVSKFKIEYLSVKDFYNVFLYLECKGATEEKVRETLQNMIQPDDQGKFSYKEFIAEFKAGTQIEAVQARKGRRLYQSRDEIIHRIAYVIENRGLKTFGSLLADQDAEGKLEIERDQFYRTIDSLQFSLGEGDIQELIRGYSKGQLVDLIRFKDDLNALISSQEYKVELKSLLNNLINERVVETLEATTLKVKHNNDPKTQAQFRILAREITCGLYVKDSDVMSWFQKFGTFKKGSLTNREFQQALESLDITIVFEKPDSIVAAYYENLVSRQVNTLGYNETLLLIDQLNLMSSKDCPTPNRQKMIEDILQSVAIHICDNRLPLGDILTTFDTQRSSLIYRSDFHTTFLDNYLNMQWNSKNSTGLSLNQKLLLTTKYAPTQSTVSFPYQQFVDDMVRKQQESRGSIHVYMTKKEIDDDQAFFEEEKLNSGDQHVQQVVTLKDLPALSKRNTHVVDRTVTKPQLKGSMQIAPFCFDDMMMSTYRKGLSIEMYFRAYSKTISGDQVLLKEDFGRALASLGIDWSSNVSKVNEIFDSLDTASHGGILSKYVTPGDIGEAVFLNSSSNIEDILAVTIMAIHKALKQKNMLGQLRELFNFFNSKRDNTCQAKEFKTIILEKLELDQVVRDNQVDYLLQRYKPQDQEGRVDFSLFIKDMEFCDLGISPALVWAISLATNILKSLIVFGITSMEQFYQKYSRMQGVLMQDEFSRSLNELQLDMYHPEDQQRDFFNHVQYTQTGGMQNPNQSSKISITQLVNTIKLLCPKTPGLINQEIFERLWAESKKNNMSTTTVQSIFSEFDTEKTGMITYDVFRKALEDKLKIKSLIMLDIQVLAKRYTGRGGQSEEMIQYDKFFQDYERFEQMGLRAGFDPLKDKQQAQSKIVQQQKEISPEVRKIYSDMATFCTKNGFSDKICDALGQKDSQAHRGTLTYKQILEVFQSFKIMLVTKQMSLIIEPLPVDQLDSSYNYLMLIEIMFGKQKAQEIQLRYKGGGLAGPSNSLTQRSQPQEMSQRFKDSIEVKYSSLLGIVHQISKGSYLLKESEFTKVFRQVGIVVTSQDHELLLYAYNSLRSIQSQSLDFQQFIRSFQISETTSLIISALQKEIATNNIRISDEDGGTIFPPQKETVTVEDFQRFLSQQNIKLQNFTPQQVQYCYLQISNRREKMEKTQLIRILKNERDSPSQQQEWLPFIANEFIYHLINRNLDIFKFVNPTAKRLTLPQFQMLLDKLQYRPSNPKDMPTLQEFFALLPETEEKFISIEKIVMQVRKLNPSYANTAIKQQTLPSEKTLASAKPTNSSKAVEITAVKQLSQFSIKVKDTLQKINDQLKRNGITSKQLFEKVDINKNGIVEKAEMMQFFANQIQVKGVTSDDIDLLFDTLDMNKDNLVSLNEFCLCLEGVQNTVDQRIKSFDPDLEKSLKDEINFLFDFFDTDKNGSISQQELQFALKAQHPLITLAEINSIMKQADTDKSQSIDRSEFMSVMLPQLKLEMMSYEKNLDDLRRMFKEFDFDQSNYLSKDELRQAFIKLGITLTDVQMDELMREIDLDNNQVIDIDEFIAFLSIADQIKFKNPNTKSIIVKIKQSRKLQAIDFYNCFKNLPQFFQPSVTQENLEKRYVNTPSWGIYPEFDSKTMQYKDMQKLEEVTRMPQKKFIELYQPQIACEMFLEEISGVPLPKKEDYDWSNITNRELRVVLVDIRTQELLSNTFIVSASWKQEFPGKWLFNASETHAAAKTLLVRADVATASQQYTHLLFELVLFTLDVSQQICCAWGSVPVSQLDKQTKLKVQLKGGSFLQEMKVSKGDVHQEKKGFEFLKMLTASSDNEAVMTVSVKPIGRLSEAAQMQVSMLPQNCVINRRLLSFVAAFRLFAFKKLTKAQQQLLAPSGNFSIAQFRRIFDNPDVNLLLADCWDEPASTTSIEQLLPKMDDSLTKLYALIYSEDFHFDHVYPTRSLALDSDLFQARESLIKAQLAPAKFKKLMPVKKLGKENNHEYKPFNIAEMEIAISGIDQVEAKQDELTKMYQQMGLLF